MFLIHSFNGHLSYFPLLALVIKAEMKIRIQVSECVCMLSRFSCV